MATVLSAIGGVGVICIVGAIGLFFYVDYLERNGRNPFL